MYQAVAVLAGFKYPRPPKMLKRTVNKNVNHATTTQNKSVHDPESGNRIIPPNVMTAVQKFAMRTSGVLTVKNANIPQPDVSGRKFHMI